MKIAKFHLTDIQAPAKSYEIADALLSQINRQLIKDIVTAIRANGRQWSASTRGRSEVNHSRKKPHRQKGLGRARQGRLSSPQYKGGGVVFGPKPKFDQHVSINKRQRRQAVAQLLSQGARDEKLYVLEGAELEAPKTSTIVKFLKARGLEGKRVLFVGRGKQMVLEIEEQAFAFDIADDSHAEFFLSIRNIPKIRMAQVAHLNAYDLCLADAVIFLEDAAQDIEKVLELGVAS